MGQWVIPFSKNGMQLIPHVATDHPFDPLTLDSIIDMVVLMDGKGDVEPIRKDLVGQPLRMVLDYAVYD